MLYYLETYCKLCRTLADELVKSCLGLMEDRRFLSALLRSGCPSVGALGLILGSADELY